jgi:hypothetical protein
MSELTPTSSLSTKLKNLVIKVNQFLRQGWEWLTGKLSPLAKKILGWIQRLSVTKDAIYVWNTVNTLNPSVRIGVILALSILLYLYYAPTIVLVKLSKMAGFLMTLLIFIMMFGWVFFLFRTTSDTMDIGDSFHETIQPYKRQMGETMAHSVGGVLITAPDTKMLKDSDTDLS